MNKSDQVKSMAAEIDYVHEQIECDRPIGEILNRLIDKGFTRRMAVICVQQAQSELNR